MRPTWGNHYLLSAKINSLVFILQSEATFSGAPCQDELGIWNKMSMYQNRNTLTNTEKYWAPFFFATTVMRWTALNKDSKHSSLIFQPLPVEWILFEEGDLQVGGGNSGVFVGAHIFCPLLKLSFQIDFHALFDKDLKVIPTVLP